MHKAKKQQEGSWMKLIEPYRAGPKAMVQGKSHLMQFWCPCIEHETEEAKACVTAGLAANINSL